MVWLSLLFGRTARGPVRGVCNRTTWSQNMGRCFQCRSRFNFVQTYQKVVAFGQTFAHTFGRNRKSPACGKFADDEIQ